MSLNWGDVLVWPWKSYLYMETHNSITIFYSARRRRKIFQIVLEKINFGPKIRVPPPGKIQKFHFLAKTFPPQPKKKFVSPPGKSYQKFSFLPKSLGWNHTMQSVDPHICGGSYARHSVDTNFWFWCISFWKYLSKIPPEVPMSIPSGPYLVPFSPKMWSLFGSYQDHNWLKITKALQKAWFTDSINMNLLKTFVLMTWKAPPPHNNEKSKPKSKPP